MAKPALWVLSAALVVLAIAYQWIAFTSLLFGHGETVPVDFRLRWVESCLFIEGKDCHTYGHPDPELPPRLHWQRTMGGYLPFSTVIGLLLAPPVSWTIARTYFACLNVVSLVVIASWAFRRGAAQGKAHGIFMVAAVVACAPVAICISYGQYGVLITAFLLLALYSLVQNKQLAAGCWLGLSLVKPQLVGVALLVVLFRRYFVAAAVAGAFIVAGCLVNWAATGIEPLTSLKHSQEDARSFAFMSVNPLTEYLLPKFGFETTTRMLAGLFGVAAIGLALVKPRRIRLETLFAVSTILCMFWSYRRPYDCPLLIIPMVLLFEVAMRRGHWLHWTLAMAFGISLWLPIRNDQWLWSVVQMGHLAVWSAGAVLLVHDNVVAAKHVPAVMPASNLDAGVTVSASSAA
jgi:hypothetical protein